MAILRASPARAVRTAIVMFALMCAGRSGAEGEQNQPVAPEPAPPVAYDALFRLPADTGVDRETAGGLDRQRWEERFAAVHGDLRKARDSLARAQAELESLARKTESWQMAAPGAQPSAENSPISYKLRQDIRQYREDVARSERRLRELETEASLAGVPAEWRKEPRLEDAAPGS
jgi:hypothetical protein